MPTRLLRRLIPIVFVTLLVLSPMVSPLLAAEPAGTSAEPKDKAAAATDGTQPNQAKDVPTPAPANSFGVAEAKPFTESTTVQGKTKVDLKGVWLLVALVEVSPGKFRTFPQVFKVTDGKNGPEFHLLDVQLPERVKQGVKEANQTLAGWHPDEETRKMLAQNWSHLPQAKQKAIDEELYWKINYEVVSPDHYQDAFVERTEAINKALDGSKLGMRITERYSPRELGPDYSRVIQLMGRTTYYGVKVEEKNLLKGDLHVGFLAAGHTPLPYQFNGPFMMYRLAS